MERGEGPGGWVVEHRRGDAHELHHGELDGSTRRLLVAELTRPAVVLGSTQQLQPDADLPPGFDLVRRRSGGGMVVLEPGHDVWIDVVVPAGDPLWDDDVERATWFLGEAWATVVDRLSAPGSPDAVVHRRGVEDRTLGRIACFASLGPGEVSVGGVKVVGISQRRTRSHARFQCLLPLRWDPGTLLGVLGEHEHRDELRRALYERAGGVVPPVGWSAVEELVRALP